MQHVIYAKYCLYALIYVLLILFLGKIQQQQMIAAYASLTLLCSVSILLFWKFKITVVSTESL